MAYVAPINSATPHQLFFIFNVLIGAISQLPDDLLHVGSVVTAFAFQGVIKLVHQVK